MRNLRRKVARYFGVHQRPDAPTDTQMFSLVHANHVPLIPVIDDQGWYMLGLVENLTKYVYLGTLQSGNVHFSLL